LESSGPPSNGRNHWIRQRPRVGVVSRMVLTRRGDCGRSTKLAETILDLGGHPTVGAPRSRGGPRGPSPYARGGVPYWAGGPTVPTLRGPKSQNSRFPRDPSESAVPPNPPKIRRSPKIRRKSSVIPKIRRQPHALARRRWPCTGTMLWARVDAVFGVGPGLMLFLPPVFPSAPPPIHSVCCSILFYYLLF
jgi:hypothetical protein